MIRRPPISTLFPYTTLSRSRARIGLLHEPQQRCRPGHASVSHGVGGPGRELQNLRAALRRDHRAAVELLGHISRRAERARLAESDGHAFQRNDHSLKTTGYPANPSDGVLVVDRPNAPGTFDSFVHP